MSSWKAHELLYHNDYRCYMNTPRAALARLTTLSGCHSPQALFDLFHIADLMTYSLNWYLWHVTSTLHRRKLRGFRIFNFLWNKKCYIVYSRLQFGKVYVTQHTQNPANTKHIILYNICTMLAQWRIRWSNVVQMLFKCFVFAEKLIRYIEVKNIAWIVHPSWFIKIFQCFNPYSAGTDFSRQNLTSVDVRFWRLKSIPAL